jgi:formylglycine-generating enzyme required for sulfatase activity/dienelactone hydrolase
MKERRVFKFCFRADRVRSLKREMTLFRLIKDRIGDHPHIVALREVYFEQPPYYLEEDYVAGDDLVSWCKSQGGAGNVPLGVKLEIVAQIAEALQAAHHAGVIHRDVKPANILVRGSRRDDVASGSSAGASAKSEFAHVGGHEVVAKLTDFGIGQVVSQEILVGVTKAGFTETMMAKSSSYQTGTLLYLAPELIAGSPASASSDIYSLGVVLYQLVTGDLTRPITTDWSQQIADPLLREDLAHCFAGQPEERFTTASALAGNLRALDERRAVWAKQEAAAKARQKVAQRWRVIRLASVGALILGLGGSLFWYSQRGAKARWAREQAIPEITRLAKEDNSIAALALARQAAKYIPQDPALTNLWPQISVLATLETQPAGADIYVREYRKTNAPWQYIGQSPVRNARLPTGVHRWRIRKEGYIPLEVAGRTSDFTNTFTLDTAASLPPGMVRVSRAEVLMFLTGLDHLDPVYLEDYFIDKYEVSNRQYQDFVAHGGYQTTNFWKQPFLKQGRSFTWSEAMVEFKDATGQPGPATWKNGTYPDGQADYPVSGVSWYEAAAYAEFAGKRLPSLYHWNQAAGLRLSAHLIPMSNFAARGPAPVGSYEGMSPAGLLDMAGNVKEWCWNEADDGKRYILGGAWNEPEYMFPDPDAQSPFDRRATFGFRCMKVLAAESWPKQVDARITPVRRNFALEKPVSEETFRVYRNFFSYDRTPLDARTESVDDTAPLWRKEKVVVNAAYGDERFTIYLLLPRKSRPPFQGVVYFPGSAVIYMRSSANLSHLWVLESLIESGRAVIYPIYKGTLERGDGLKSDDPAPTSSYRDHVIQWSKDLGRTIDYLETRSDIQQQTLAFCGYSWGAALGALLPALESRLKASVLVCGGFYFQPTVPEVDQINFAPRVTIPTLMLNGRFDFYYPVESSQQPMFQLLGTSPEHKRHVLFDAGHDVPKDELVKEVRQWLDRYLGPVPAVP